MQRGGGTGSTMGEEGKASEDKGPATTPSLHGGVTVQSGSGAMAAAASKADLELQLVSGTDHERGLTGAEHKARLEQYGRNALPETKENMLLVFLSYYWGPMPCMIWVAILVEAVNTGWEDFAVLLVLQALNGAVGFLEERNAGNAIAALKNSLRPGCTVCRDGMWAAGDATTLVPGDLIELVAGAVVPADAVILEGEPLQVDQSALTGESLPATVRPGQKVLMGSAVKRGEINAVVVATGVDTFFGKAAKLLDVKSKQGHLAHILFLITMWLLVLSVILCSILFVHLLYIADHVDSNAVLSALSVVIVLLVSSIPIATQVVCTSTMAIGSRILAKRKVIVARLSAIEELAAMSILCTDKTGTLTLNKLSLHEVVLVGDDAPASRADVVLHAALAAKKGEMQDAIDRCITAALTPEQRRLAGQYVQEEYIPFNPVDKRTEATLRLPGGVGTVRVTKGAPQVILAMAHNAEQLQPAAEAAIQSLADRGFRAVAVAASRPARTGPRRTDADAVADLLADKFGDDDVVWEYLGILALSDPPRPDTRETIHKAMELGVEVKMITGDQTAIAKETCRELGMGTNILDTAALTDGVEGVGANVDQIIMASHGFAEVFPEHKFMIVDRIRRLGHVTGMTGDGVNDAPALKRADIGIAVEGATDAARAAADVVLVEPGLSVIVEAIELSRAIFMRMRNYILYRIACTVQLLFFFFIASLFIRPDAVSNGFDAAANFTLPVLALVVITILNDGAMITIARDNVKPEPKPTKWNLGEVVIVSSVLGFVACVSSLLLLVIGLRSHAGANPSWYGDLLGSQQSPFTGATYVSLKELRTLLYLKISLSDFFTMFSARTRGFFWTHRPGNLVLIACGVATFTSSMLALFWPFSAEPGPGNLDPMAPVAFKPVAVVWLYNIVWFLVQDACKVALYAMLRRGGQVAAEDKASLQRRATAHITTSLAHDEKATRQSYRNFTSWRVAGPGAARVHAMARTASLASITPPRGSGAGAGAGAGVSPSPLRRPRSMSAEALARKVDRLEARLHHGTAQRHASRVEALEAEVQRLASLVEALQTALGHVALGRMTTPRTPSPLDHK